MAYQNGNHQNGFTHTQPERPFVSPTSSFSSGRSRTNPLTNAASYITTGAIGPRPPSPTRSETPPSGTSLEITRALNAYDSQYLPHHTKSLSGIAFRSFCLGNTLAISTLLTLYFLYNANPIWRIPFFISTLSLFHFLEFYTTSLTNTPAANIASFLLTANSQTYFLAQSISFIETLLVTLIHPTPFLPNTIHNTLLLFGLFLLVLGQSIRAIAMLQAGTNFSHIIKQTKSSTHILVKTGIYSILRHPSYFGFFWWGIGTQLVSGNLVGLVGYAIVLWLFFARRIAGEERLLVGFFGDEYIEYRKNTWTGIPFVK